MSNKRTRRLSEAYLKEISNILHYKIRDPQLAGVYVTHVVFTPDLRLAKIYFNVSGGRLREAEVIRGFERSKGFLKRELASRVRTKYAPDIRFYYDESEEVRERIEKLFEEIHEQKNEQSKKY